MIVLNRSNIGPIYWKSSLKLAKNANSANSHLWEPYASWGTPQSCLRKQLMAGTYRINICSWNISKTFPWYIPGIFRKSSLWNSGEYSQMILRDIDYRNIPSMFHEYPMNVTCSFLGGSRNTLVVFSSG